MMLADPVAAASPPAPPPVRAGLRARAWHLVAVVLVVAGLGWRLGPLVEEPFHVDEAESSINALTIQDHGYPGSHYMGLPLYENVLQPAVRPDPEHQFADSSYSNRGVAVYHGWLPLYSIAAAQWLFGLHPDPMPTEPAVRHHHQLAWRTIVPRLPALLYSALFLGTLYVLAHQVAGPAAALAALTWAAFSEGTVAFGYQARYYSATLALTTLTALALWRAHRTGGRRDFLFLGAAGALLFHTHQLSALVMAGVAALAAPALLGTPVRRRRAAAAAGLALGLTVPWAWWTGFFETAVHVPKIAGMFGGPAEWARFTFGQRQAVIVVGGALLLLLLLSGRWTSRPGRLAVPAPWRGPVYLVVGWLLLAFAAVHLLLPAASYFPARVMLMLQVPGILLLSLVLAAAVRAAAWMPARVLAPAGAALLLVLSGRAAAWPSFHFDPDRHGRSHYASLDRSYPRATRFYASPNDQLIYQYFTGLPVQSVAPIQRRFLATYPGPIVFIESRHRVAPQLEEVVQQAARAQGHEAPPGRVAQWAETVRLHQIEAELAARGLPRPEVPPLPRFLHPVRDHLHEASAAYIGRSRERLPILRDVDVQTPGDLWLAFAYRFVGYEGRIGPNLNIQPRLEEAVVEVMPDGKALLFFCPPLATAAAVADAPPPAAIAKPFPLHP